MQFDCKDNFSGKISDKQAMVAADIISGDPSDSIDTILARHGVSSVEYASWLRTGFYIEYLLSLSNTAAAAEEPHVLRSLIDMSKNGNMQAIKLFFDLQNKRKSTECFSDEFHGIQTKIFGEDFVSSDLPEDD